MVGGVKPLGLRPFVGVVLVMGFKDGFARIFKEKVSGGCVAGSASVRWCYGGDKFLGRVAVASLAL